MEAMLFEAAPLLTGMLGISPRALRPCRLAAAPDFHGTVSTLRTMAEIEALEEEWLALAAGPRSPATPFQTFAFHREWTRHFAGGDTQVRIVALRQEGQLKLILPVAVTRTPVGRIAGWIGDPLIQYGDVIAAPDIDLESALDAAFAELIGPGDIALVLLRRVRADAAVAPWLARRMAAVGTPDEAPAVDLSGFSHPGAFADTRRSRASRNRKRRNKLAELGAVGFRIVEGGDEAVRLVGDAIALKEAWLEARGLIGRAFVDCRTRLCLEALARDLSGSAGTVISALEVDGRPAAVEVGFRHNGHYCAFLGAFDQALAKHSPGQVQMQATIEWCIAKGMKTYDLMAPADDYKRQLSTHSVAVQDHAALLSMTGIPAALWSAYGTRSLKAAFAMLPRAVRSMIRARFG